MLAMFGTQEEIQRFNQKLEILMMGVGAILAILWLQMIWRAIFHFAVLYLALCFLLPLVVVKFLITLGVAQSVFQININFEPYGPHTIIVNIIGGIVIILLLIELFPKKTWLRGLWIFIVIAIFNLLFYFFQPEIATVIDSYLRIFGTSVFILCCCWAAVDSKKILQSFNEKMALAIVIFIGVMGLLFAMQTRGFLASVDTFQSGSSIFLTICIRIIIPLAMIGISIWLFERMRLSRMADLRSDLTDSRQTLERELKRLEQLKLFNTLLVHEIKNQLFASQLALAHIGNTLPLNNSVRQNVVNIKSSLIDINAILDRCVEVDGYEHGEMPLRISGFTLGNLLEFISLNNPDERVCTVIEDIPHETLIHSDPQYLKIILGNLLSNALKYSESGSPVELRVNRCLSGTQNEAVFYVSNTPGDAGVPDRLRLFDRFYRADGARSQSGAGLGLWLAQSLATALSTKITFDIKNNKLVFSFPLILR